MQEFIQTRSQLNLDNKREICEYAKRHPKAKHGEIANYFNKKFNLSIDHSTVSFNEERKWLDLPPSRQTSSTFRYQRLTCFTKIFKSTECQRVSIETATKN